MELPSPSSWATEKAYPSLLKLLNAFPGGGLLKIPLSWQELESQEGLWDEDLLRRLEKSLGDLRSRGWKTLILLQRGTLPDWLEAQGGWARLRALDRFDLYTAWVAGRLGAQADFWCSLENPARSALSYPPGRAGSPVDLSGAPARLANLLSAHGRAFRVLKRESPSVPVGLGLSLEASQPLRPDWAPDRWAAGLWDRLLHGSVLEALGQGRFRALLRTWSVPEAKGTLDFLGFLYETRRIWRFDPLQPGSYFLKSCAVPGAPRSATGEDVYPAGLAPALERARSLGKPVLILGNSLSDGAGRLAPAHLVSHLESLRPGLAGEPSLLAYVRGPLLDENADPGRGFYEGSLERARARPLVDFYSDIWRENSLPALLSRQFGTALLLGAAT